MPIWHKFKYFFCHFFAKLAKIVLANYVCSQKDEDEESSEKTRKKSKEKKYKAYTKYI